MSNVLINFGFVLVFILAMWGGNFFCKTILEVTKIIIPKDPHAKAGWLIGILERIIIGIGILLRSWEIVVGVVALKSISRYKELDQQLNAEYFLIGSMVSIIWAFLVTIVFIGLCQYFKDSSWMQPNLFNYIQSLAAKP